jgi:hypothetical protein
MRQKVALIAKIRAIESVPVIRFKVSLLFRRQTFGPFQTSLTFVFTIKNVREVMK